MTEESALRRWWRQLWPAAGPAAPEAPARAAAGAGGDTAVEPGRPVAPRRYTAPPRDDDPQREAHLGAVLEAVGGGPLTRARLAERVGAADWGPGRLDAVVAHGVASGVLVEDGDGVRARYAD